MTGPAGLVLALVLIGAAWGMTQPLGKIAVSTGHGPLGLIFWQLVIGVLVLGPLVLWRRRGVPLHRGALLIYLAIAAFGTLLPNSASYVAARTLPAGVMSIVIAMVPIFAFPIALALRADRFGWARLCGLLLGLAGVALIALPEASLPDRAMVAALPIALIAPFFYAVEGNLVGRWGTAGADPIQTLFGASALGAAVTLPLALFSGQWIDPIDGIGRPEAALIVSSLLHAVTYAGYVWLIGRAGAVFSAQVSYVVTGFGVIWAMLLLGESYSGWIWLALVAMLGGLALVQPRPSGTVALTGTPADNPPDTIDGSGLPT